VKRVVTGTTISSVRFYGTLRETTATFMQTGLFLVWRKKMTWMFKGLNLKVVIGAPLVGIVLYLVGEPAWIAVFGGFLALLVIGQYG
jgi:hypothetical protein